MAHIRIIYLYVVFIVSSSLMFTLMLLDLLKQSTACFTARVLCWFP